MSWPKQRIFAKFAIHKLIYQYQPVAMVALNESSPNQRVVIIKHAFNVQTISSL